MKKICLLALMVLGFSFVSNYTKAQTSSSLSKTSQTTELSASTNNQMASTLEAKTTVTEKSSVVTKPQKPNHPKKKDWEERTIVGKILIITGAAIFAVICLMYGTVTVG